MPAPEPVEIGKIPAAKPSAAKASSPGEPKVAGPVGGAAGLTCRGIPGVGKSASPFSLLSLNGSTTGLPTGKVTVIDFWATWCAPCQRSFPGYQALYVKYKASGLEIVGISVDEAQTGIPGFVKTHSVGFPVGWDEGRRVTDCYQPQSIPTAYVLDRNGIVRHVHHGYRDGEEIELEKEIKALL